MNSEKQKQLDELNKKIYECENCNLCKIPINLGEGKLKGEGNNSDILVVCQNPSYWRKTAGVFMPGSRNNDLLIKMFKEECGLERNNYYVTNCVKCSTLKNIDIKEHQMKACVEYLKEEMKILKPKILICVGAVAGKYFKIDVKEIRIALDGITYCRVDHPAYILRGGLSADVYRKQFKFIKKYIDKCTKNELK